MRLIGRSGLSPTTQLKSIRGGGTCRLPVWSYMRCSGSGTGPFAKWPMDSCELSLTHMVYLFPICGYLAGSESLSPTLRQPIRPSSAPDTMTVTALEATASSSGNKEIILTNILLYAQLSDFKTINCIWPICYFRWILEQYVSYIPTSFRSGRPKLSTQICYVCYNLAMTLRIWAWDQ